LDREALVARNLAMADAYKLTPVKHLVRRLLLRAAGVVPFAPMPRASRRMLLIRPDHLGDIILTIPAIRALKAARPDLELHALVGPWSAAALENVAELDRVLTLPFPGFTRSENESLPSPYAFAVKTSRMLRRIGYDTAIILRPDHWWGALVAHLAGIRRRVGYDLPDVAPFLTEALAYEPAHSVVLSLWLVEAWTPPIQPEQTALHFQFTAADEQDVDALLKRHGLTPDSRLVCIHPGSGTWTKQWDEGRWAQVGDLLAAQLDASIVLTGRDHELPMVNRIAEAMAQPAAVAAGETPVGALAALFARAMVVLGPDSGPLHLAAAVQTPTVALFGPAKIGEFGTWGPAERHAILASDIGCLGCGVLDWGADDPANHPCLRDIAVGRVLESARRVARR
jgi:ADP-heptose:LPS heptosyltransferase